MTANSFTRASMLAVAVCILLSVQPASAQKLTKSGRYYVADIEKTFKVTGAGTLTIRGVSGSVFVSSWERSEVQIKEIKKMDVFTEKEAETVLERSESSYRQQGNDIFVDGEHSRRDWVKSKFEVWAPKSFSVDLDTRGGDIRVSNLTGTANIQTSGGDIALNEIGGEIDARTSGGDIEVSGAEKEVSLRTSGGDLELRRILGPLTGRTSGGEIKLTESQGEVKLHTSGGSIEIDQVRGEVEAHTSGGDIVVTDATASVEVQTSGGDIEFRNIGGSLEAETSGGDIEGKAVSGDARVSTAGGDIEIHDLRGGVEGKTAGGDIEVEMTLQDFSKNHAVFLRTAGGEIRLTIPEKLPASIRAEIEVEDRWESYDIYSDFPLTSSDGSEGVKSRRKRGRRISSEGAINGGGDPIELFTRDGNIYIKKLAR